MLCRKIIGSLVASLCLSAATVLAAPPQMQSMQNPVLRAAAPHHIAWDVEIYQKINGKESVLVKEQVDKMTSEKGNRLYSGSHFSVLESSGDNVVVLRIKNTPIDGNKVSETYIFVASRNGYERPLLDKNLFVRAKGILPRHDIDEDEKSSHYGEFVLH